MKIFYYSGLGQGGAERQVVESAHLMYKKGHEVKIFTYDEQRNFYDIDKGIEIIDLKSEFRFPSILNKIFSTIKLYFYLIKLKPTFAISYITKINSSLGFVGLLPFVRNKTKFLGSERTSKLRYENSMIWRLICHISYRGLDGIFTNNREALKKISKCLGISPNKTFYLPNLLRTDIYRKETYIKQMKDSFVKILVPGRLDDNKNQKILVPIAQNLKAANKNVVFVLAGNDTTNYAKELKALIREQKLEDSIKVLGEAKNIIELYNSCDYMMLPSKVEGLPNVLLESMSCEMVCMGSKIESITAIIKDGHNGFLIPLNDIDKITEKIISVISMDEGNKNYIRSNAKKTAEEYSPEMYYEKLVGILELV